MHTHTDMIKHWADDLFAAVDGYSIARKRKEKEGWLIPHSAFPRPSWCLCNIRIVAIFKKLVCPEINDNSIYLQVLFQICRWLIGGRWTKLACHERVCDGVHCHKPRQHFCCGQLVITLSPIWNECFTCDGWTETFYRLDLMPPHPKFDLELEHL